MCIGGCTAAPMRSGFLDDFRPHRALNPTVGGNPDAPTDANVHGQVVQLPKCKGWAEVVHQKLEDMVVYVHFHIASGNIVATLVT